MGDLQILFDTYPAPLFSLQANEAVVSVPFEVGSQSSTVIQVKVKGVTSNPIQVPVQPTAPGVFVVNAPGTSVGAILNVDGTPNSASNPAPPGSAITVYYTGEGQSDPPSVTGSLNSSSGTLPVPVAVTSATIQGFPAQVVSYGPAAGQVAGLSQATIAIPALVIAGSQPLVLTCGGVASQAGVFVWVSN